MRNILRLTALAAVLVLTLSTATPTRAGVIPIGVDQCDPEVRQCTEAAPGGGEEPGDDGQEPGDSDPANAAASLAAVLLLMQGIVRLS